MMQPIDSSYQAPGLDRPHRKTKAVVYPHLLALKTRKLDDMLETYAEGAVFLGNMTPAAIQGWEALRSFWTEVFMIFTPEVLTQLTIRQEQCEGDVGYLFWSARRKHAVWFRHIRGT